MLNILSILNKKKNYKNLKKVRKMSEKRKIKIDASNVKVRRYGARKYRKQQAQNKNKTSRTWGIHLVGIQIFASIIFLLSFFMLGMLPGKYLAVLGGILLFIDSLSMIGQIKAKKKGILGKIISIILILSFLTGSFYIYRTDQTVDEVSGGTTKLDNIIAVVPIDDSAEVIQDAADYSFGVQYAIKGDDIRQTVSAICNELGTEIETVECASVQEQAEKLHDGEVDAIILNEAYLNMLEDEFDDFSSNVKIIYSRGIATEIVAITNNIKVEDESFAVYISGIDVYGPIEKNSRSDVNILAVINPTSHQIMLVTTPRDYYVSFPGVTGEAKDKLTHAGIYGVDVSMATLNELYDMETDFYARVNFTSLIEMVDALGGIDVYSKYAFTTVGGLNVQQGINHFNGKQALSFSRERKNVPGGDFQRGKNQQAVITAMIQKVLSPSMLVSANSLLETVSGNVDTNMTSEQIQNLIKSQLADPQIWRIKSVSAEGVGDKQYCYSMPGVQLYVTQPDYDSINAIKETIKAVENGEIFEDSAMTQ